MSSPPVLEAPLETVYLPVATSFVENSARALKLDRSEAMSLTLASEEVFMGLCELSSEARWEVSDGGSFIELTVEFKSNDLELHHLNLTAGVDPTDDSQVRQLGWLLAARSVDRFQIEHKGEMTRFHLRKDRYFAEAQPESAPLTEGSLNELRVPDDQELLLFAKRVLGKEDARILPGFLRKPGKMLAMIEVEKLQALLAFNESGNILGGGFVERRHGRVAALHGPYLLTSQDLGPEIFHQLLNELAKSNLVGVVTEAPVLNLPKSEVEPLGTRTLQLGEERVTLHSAFRHLEEDEGFSVWSSPWLDDFLEKEYDRLALPRDQHTWQPIASKRAHSILSCDFRQATGQVTLRPVLAGEDASENLKDHLELLDRESIPNIFFELDLGHSWHLSFADSLKENGFEPCYLVPSAGRGDILVLQRGGLQ